MRSSSKTTSNDRTDRAAVDELINPTDPSMTSTHDDAPAGCQPRRIRVSPIAVGAVVAILALTTGCSSAATSTASSSSSTSAAAEESSSPSSDPAGKEEVCAARDQLKTSVTALTSASLLTGGTDGIKAAVQQVQTDLTAVKTAGKQTYETEVDAMQSAVDQLQTAADNLGNGDTAQNLQAVGTAIASTGVAAEDLFTKLKAACGS